MKRSNLPQVLELEQKIKECEKVLVTAICFSFPKDETMFEFKFIVDVPRSDEALIGEFKSLIEGLRSSFHSILNDRIVELTKEMEEL